MKWLALSIAIKLHLLGPSIIHLSYDTMDLLQSDGILAYLYTCHKTVAANSRRYLGDDEVEYKGKNSVYNSCRYERPFSLVQMLVEPQYLTNVLTSKDSYTKLGASHEQI